MLVLARQCSICARVKKDKQLLKRLYASSWFVPHSRESVRDIVKLYNLSYQATLNHLKKHQFIDSQDYTDKMLQHADRQAKELAVRKAVKAHDAVQTIIDKGMERLESGEINVDTNQLIRASQVRMAYDAKKKDQELATIEMVAHFLSGENASSRVYIDADTD